jgi:REP element-mobilizing transposase RayT
VTLRGIERREIFADDADREALLLRLDRLARRFRFRILGWALMPNHIHLVIQLEECSLARFMACLATSYALYFNRRHGRAGHLFQNRYWSRPLDEDLETVVIYVHENPVRADLTTAAALHRYPWCGHGTAVGARAPRLFERDPDVGLEAGTAPDIAAILDDECGRAAVSPAAVLEGARSREASEARRRVVVRALRETGRSSAEIAATLGVARSTVSQIARRST